MREEDRWENENVAGQRGKMRAKARERTHEHIGIKKKYERRERRRKMRR